MALVYSKTECQLLPIASFFVVNVYAHEKSFHSNFTIYITCTSVPYPLKGIKVLIK